MEGFDHGETYQSANFFSQDDNQDENNQATNLKQYKKKFKEFLRQFHEGNFNYKYRDNLKRNYNLKQYWVEINLADLAAYDESLAEKVYKQPTEYLPIFEDAAKEVADEITNPRPPSEEEMEDIQILLSSEANCTSLRGMKPDTVSKLIKISGIVISATGIRAKAKAISIQCRSCRNVVPNIQIRPGLEGYPMPRLCGVEQAGRPKCPLDPYFIMPDKCKCVDFQTLKLQELHEQVPQGEMPRHVQLYVDRYLCDRVVPGNKVMILGILSIRKVAKTGVKQGSKDKALVGIRSSYIRVIGISIDGENNGNSGSFKVFSPEEEEIFRRLAADPDIYDRITKSIAPSIYGAADMKKAIACLLFGGSRKRMPDGLCRRGDINVLMIGDPGTAKSQLLKFVENVAPVGVYTSGKGSSAAGLTASVSRDPSTRNFMMEGGAMVLADGGVVCIDEFDKMREDDRVAIHEAMEQQTISIAKAGITTTLNTRCSVLAAANSIYGRWDDTKGEENLNFMPTILSRFDMIFIVKDEHQANRDITLAKHVLSLHANADHIDNSAPEGELSVGLLKKYIHYCRLNCGPRLTLEAAEKLKNRYVMMRTSADQHEKDSDKKHSIPITVRQLEAVIRISESLAKMKMLPFANETDVDEALRLFQVSTMSAATSGSLAGAEGFTTNEDYEMLTRIEKQLKRRFAIGTQVSEQNIIQDFVKQKYAEGAVRKVICTMIRRGELQHRVQRKMLYRLF